jgi:hypothetical protein
MVAAHLAPRSDAACSKLSQGNNCDLKPAKHLAYPLELTLAAEYRKSATIGIAFLDHILHT